MKNDHDLRVSVRTARLLASDGVDDDGPPWRFSGIAVAAGDILHMEDGTPVLFTEENLRAAAETQTDEPLTVDHPTDDDGRPQYPPPTDETVGKVPKAGWLPDQEAVGYEATTHDEDVATGVQGGSYEVSVHPTFELGAQDPETGAYVAENIQFRDLSVVSKGDSPSNTAEWGPNHALAKYTEETDIGAQLTAADDADDPADGRQGVVSTVVQTLRAVGFTPDDDVDPDELAETMGAESPVDDSQINTMDDDTRAEYRSFITANADFDESDVEEMSDSVLEQTHEVVAEAAADSAAGDSTNDDDNPDDDPSDDKTLGDMTVDELGDALRDQGFVTEDNAGDLVAEAQAQQTKAEKVSEIIAKSDDYDEEDREGLMASADKVVDREHDRVTSTPNSQLPGAAGLTANATPSPGADGGDEDLDEYDTGVADD